MKNFYLCPSAVAAAWAKVARLPHPKSISIRTALVYEGELSKTVEGDGYFDALVPIEVLLKKGCGTP